MRKGEGECFFPRERDCFFQRERVGLDGAEEARRSERSGTEKVDGQRSGGIEDRETNSRTIALDERERTLKARRDDDREERRNERSHRVRDREGKRV